MDREDPLSDHGGLGTMAPTPEDMEPEDRANRRWAGFWFGMKLHLMVGVPLILIVALVDRDLVVAAIATLCLWQWIYLVPVIMVEYLHGRTKRARGVLTAGMATMGVATLLFFLAIALLCFGPALR